MKRVVQTGPTPNQGGPVEELVVERASASPIAAPVRRRRSAAVSRRVAGKAVTGPLRDLQAWFAAVITHPLSEGAGVAAAARRRLLRVSSAKDLERIVVSGHMPALERLHVYHYAYHARLIECLIDDFPAVQYAIGEHAFDRLARKVILVHPSQGPNLNVYGRSLLTYVDERPRACPHRVFVRELAALEWAMVEVLHAQAAPVLSIAALQAIPPERWGGIRFKPSQTARVLHFTHPVNAFLQAYREKRKPRMPRTELSATAVYRRGYTVWRMDLTAPMAAILDRLFAGDRLDTALQTLVHTTTPATQATVAKQVMNWFREWVEGGFFAAFQAPSKR